MKVTSILNAKGSHVVRMKQDASIMTAAQTMKRERIGAVVVAEQDDKIEGVLSERDIVHAIAERGLDALARSISAVMTTNVVCCSRDQTVEEVMSLMTSRRIRHLPVVDGSRLVGIVSIGDLVKHRLDELRSERDSMRDYIATA
jgi:CBS domain-containing protein